MQKNRRSQLRQLSTLCCTHTVRLHERHYTHSHTHTLEHSTKHTQVHIGIHKHKHTEPHKHARAHINTNTSLHILFVVSVSHSSTCTFPCNSEAAYTFYASSDNLSNRQLPVKIGLKETEKPIGLIFYKLCFNIPVQSGEWQISWYQAIY